METVASKQWKEVSTLGNKLINELKLNDSNDTLGKWMVHYLSELFDKETNSCGNDKKMVRLECVDIILKIWVHRKALPIADPPLASFDEIIKIIKQLRSDEPYYYRGCHRQEDTDLPEDVMTYLHFATKVDETARELVNILVNRSIKNAAIENREWLKEALSFANPLDQHMNITMELLDSYDVEQDPNKQHEVLCRTMVKFGEMCLETGKNGLESLKSEKSL